MGRKKRKKSGPLRKVSTGEISSQVWEISLNGVGSGASNTFRASSSLVDKIRGQGTNVYLNGTEHILYLPSNLSEEEIRKLLNDNMGAGISYDVNKRELNGHGKDISIARVIYDSLDQPISNGNVASDPASLQARIQSQQVELDSFKEAFGSEQESHQLELARILKEMEELEEIYKEEIQTLKDANRSNNSGLQIRIEEIERLESEKEDLNKQLEGLREQIPELVELEVDEVQEKLDQTTTELAQAKRQITSLQGDNRRYELALQSVKEANGVPTRSLSIGVLASPFPEAEQECRLCTDLKKPYDHLVSILERAGRNVPESKGTASQRFEIVFNEAVALAQSGAQYKSDNKKLRRELQEYEQRIKSQDLRLTRVELELQRKTEDVADLERRLKEGVTSDEHYKLQEDLEAAKVEVEEFRERSSQYRIENDRLVREKTTLEEQLGELQSTHEEEKVQFLGGSTEREQLQTKVDELETTLSELESDYQQQIDQKNEENAELKRKNELLKRNRTRDLQAMIKNVTHRITLIYKGHYGNLLNLLHREFPEVEAPTPEVTVAIDELKHSFSLELPRLNYGNLIQRLQKLKESSQELETSQARVEELERQVEELTQPDSETNIDGLTAEEIFAEAFKAGFHYQLEDLNKKFEETFPEGISRELKVTYTPEKEFIAQQLRTELQEIGLDSDEIDSFVDLPGFLDDYVSYGSYKDLLSETDPIVLERWIERSWSIQGTALGYPPEHEKIYQNAKAFVEELDSQEKIWQDRRRKALILQGKISELNDHYQECQALDKEEKPLQGSQITSYVYTARDKGVDRISFLLPTSLDDYNSKAAKIFNITLLENIQGMGDDIKVDEDFRGNYRIDLIYHHALDHNAERIKDKIGFIFNQLNNKTLLSQLGVQVNYALLGGCFKNE